MISHNPILILSPDEEIKIHHCTSKAFFCWIPCSPLFFLMILYPVTNRQIRRKYIKW